MRTVHRWLVVAGALSFGAACGGGDSNPAGPGGGGSADFTAKIDGASWASDASALAIQAGSTGIPGSLTIAGSKVNSATNYISLVLSVGYISGPGDYPLGVNFLSDAGGVAQVLEAAGGSFESRITPFSGVAGTLTVTSLSATRITGTFNFVAGPSPGSALTGNRTVTDGSFDLALPAGFTSVPAANHGSTFSASLGGLSWNGATIVGQGSGGVFGITATTDSFAVSLISNAVITPGSYSLGSGGGFTLTVIHTGSAISWGGHPTDVGTVVVTSIGNGRVAGTFSGTLQPGAGGGGTLSVTGGSFDVRIDSP
jgi:hypothetical protein